MLGFVCAFMSSSVCFMKLCANILCIDVYKYVISSCWIFPFGNMNWPSLFLLTSFGLTSALSVISKATHSCFWAPFAWKFFSILSYKPMFVFAHEVHLL
jgi:hypothetical protein